MQKLTFKFGDILCVSSSLVGTAVGVVNDKDFAAAKINNRINNRLEDGYPAMVIAYTQKYWNQNIKSKYTLQSFSDL